MGYLKVYGIKGCYNGIIEHKVYGIILDTIQVSHSHRPNSDLTKLCKIKEYILHQVEAIWMYFYHYQPSNGICSIFEINHIMR